MWALFSPPVSANGLLGEYYPNSDWQGAPALERVDPTLNVYFHLTPLPRPYSVEWTGTLVVPQSGIYGLGVRAVDEARLYLDGQMLVSAGPPGDYVEQLAELRAGPHELRITYQDLAGHSRIHLYWTWPDGRREIIPAGYLWPGKVSPPPAQAAPVLAQELPPLQLQWKATWGGPGHFLEPRDVAVVGESVYVADTGNRRVQVLDREGSVINSWTGVDETFEEPLALGVDSQARLLVLDSPTGWIYRFGPDGQRQGRIAGPATQSYHPRGMAVLPDGRILVADTGGGRILFLDQEGNVSGYFGGPGAAPGQFGEPTDVASDDMGTYYVVEAYNQRLQRIDRQGRTLGHWPIPSSIAFDGPHIDWALDGSLLMSAPEEGAILRYGPDGRLLGRWSQAGPAPLCRPVGLTVDRATGTLYVTDTACHNVVLFQLE
jgi:sugar lactone lactonase YvrE